MATSETEICNIALGHLGEAPITSLDEDSRAARACNLHYALTRDELLRAHRWNFAKTRLVLTELAETPAFTWAHQFQLPADCLRVVEFNDQEIGDWISEEYEIEGRALLTDAEAANIVYIKKEIDVSLYDPLFVQALALKLGIIISEQIRGTTSKTEELTRAYERLAGPLAKRVDANEGRRRKGNLPLNSQAIRARYGEAQP
jgi:hypothetical protein